MFLNTRECLFCIVHRIYKTETKTKRESKTQNSKLNSASPNETETNHTKPIETKQFVGHFLIEIEIGIDIEI